MPIQIACPACSMPLQLPDDLPGRTYRCVRCGAALATLGGGQVALQGNPPHKPNPFADDPRQGGFGPAPFQPGYYPLPVLSREAALARVRGPAILLQLCGGLCMLAGASLPLILLLPDINDDEVVYYMFLVGGSLAFAAGAFTVFCGWRMKLLRSYVLVMGAVILMMLIGLLICPLAALPAIWPLIVLLESGVRAHFDTQSPFSGS